MKPLNLGLRIDLFRTNRNHESAIQRFDLPLNLAAEPQNERIFDTAEPGLPVVKMVIGVCKLTQVRQSSPGVEMGY